MFINYSGDFFNKPKVYERVDELLRYEFECECDACEFNYRREKLISPYKNIASPFSRPPPKSIEKSIHELKDNFKFINDHAYNIMTLHCYERIQRNFDLMAFAAYYETFPY
jgi:hypothetical protein